MSNDFELRISEAHWTILHHHLFPGDLEEHGAALLCGITRGNRGNRLLVRDVVLARDGIDFVPGTRGHRLLTGEFVTEVIRRARDEKLVYLAVHNHGGTTSVEFSDVDLASHERGYPTLLDVAGQPIGALVVAERAAAGEIWLREGIRVPFARTTVVGTRLDVLTPSPTNDEPTVAARYSRQSLLYGPTGQAILGQARVAVVGAGGVGMLLIQALARLGVGHLVVVDPDRVEPTNLPRLPEAKRLDAMEYLDREGFPGWIRDYARKFAAHKVRVGRRIARRANQNVVYEGIAGDVADDTVARRITDADFIFLAADTMLARSVVNQIAHQYLIPTLQVGSKPVIDKTTGDILDVFAVVRTLGTAPGCLACTGLIDPVRLSEEALGDAVQISRQRYVEDPGVGAPSVITLNSLAAGWAANDFMQFMVGIGRPASGFRLLRSLPAPPGSSHVTVQEVDPDPFCFICGSPPASVRAEGDARDLPTRVRSRST